MRLSHPFVAQAGYNLFLAGTFTFVCDWYLILTVADQMLQAFQLKRCAGYLARAPASAARPPRFETADASRLDLARPGATGRYARHSDLADSTSAWWTTRRVVVTRVLLAAGWALGLGVQIRGYFETVAYLERDGGPDRHVGDVGAWSRASSSEFERLLAGCVVAFLNMLVVMQARARVLMTCSLGSFPYRRTGTFQISPARTSKSSRSTSRPSTSTSRESSRNFR